MRMLNSCAAGRRSCRHHGQQPDFAGDEFPARQFAVSVRGRIQQPFEVGQESDGDDHDAAVGLCREDLPVFFHGIEWSPPKNAGKTPEAATAST